MKIALPVYVEAVKRTGDPERRYRVRPLFFPAPTRQHRSLERAMSLFAADLRKHLHELGKNLRHEELAAYSFCPDLEYHTRELLLELRRKRHKGRFLLVAFDALDRRVAFTPALPDLWFDLRRGEGLDERAAEVLTRHFREKEKEDEEGFVTPEELSLHSRAWVATVELEDFRPAQEIKKKDDRPFAFLGGAEVADGRVELERVGRCLDRLYPDELERAYDRAAEVEELTRLLGAADRRPVLVVGPRLVGKTALLHEYVHQAVAKRGGAFGDKGNVWLLAPQRLISGMSYVGQWENRLLAILKAAKKQDHILAFDDLLGLYHAGVTSCSDLSVAHVLKPYVERREVRLAAEIAPEALRVLREQDRGFADLFHLLPLREPPADATLRTLVKVQRELEGKHNCRFDLDVLPTAIDLQRRYARGAAFPGKAAAFLRELAVKCRNAEATRRTALDEFHARSGLAVGFLDTQARLERKEVLDALGKGVVGQPAALAAAADVVAVAKAHLNDPERPLASFLFLGPTGVGKTQCAKAVAAYLFGDADKVLRFDMNEFVSPESAVRLVGTFGNPEGLLTSAVRRRPFAVVLLDEIEKAHLDVFDLLLQVLGEGRLTDALGRTADFTNAIVLLTSNLGVREAQKSLGFGGDDHAAGAYVRAAERFFRPEFFNRLDRIVPFDRLARADVRRIARLLIRDVFQREGLLRRRCILQVDERALERVVDTGYDPQLGARALKRAIERHLTQPVAARLAAEKPGRLTVVHLHPGPELIAVRVQELTDAPPAAAAAVDVSRPAEVLERVEAVARRVEAAFAPLRPGGEITRAALTAQHYRYFALREQTEALREAARDLADRLDMERRVAMGLVGSSYGAPVRSRRTFKTWQQTRNYGRRMGTLLQEISSAEDVHTYLSELARTAVATGDERSERLTDLVRRAALLDRMAASAAEPGGGQAVLYVRADHDGGRVATLAQILALALGEDLQLDVAEVGLARLPDAVRLLTAKGDHAEALCRIEEGTHLFAPAHENLVPVQVGVLPWPDGADPAATFLDFWGRREAWLEGVASGRAAADDDPTPLRPVVRLYEEKGSVVDVRTGLLAAHAPPRDLAEAVRAFVLATLPPPAEFSALDPSPRHVSAMHPLPRPRLAGPLAAALFLVCLGGNVALSCVGWDNTVLDAFAFRQAQTALSTLFMTGHNYAVAYETPVLGPPWSMPYEFPLYQWVVAGLATATGWPLDPTGRLVSRLFFLLTLLPAAHILGRLGVSGPLRLTALSLLLASPFYVFWSRTFLIESTALFLGTTHLALVLACLDRPRAGTILAAAALGALAGMVKVTTYAGFALLLPLLAARLLARRDGSAEPGARRRRLAALALLLVFPAAMSVVWTRFADGLKEQNQFARRLTSAGLREWNFGTWENRLDADTWETMLRRTRLAVPCPRLPLWADGAPVVAAAALAAACAAGRRRLQVASCLLVTFALPAVFTNLYWFHEYYHFANHAFLIAAVGLALAALFEGGPAARAVATTALLGTLALAPAVYLEDYYALQATNVDASLPACRAARAVTAPDDVLLVLGCDWSSEVPYYAGRRALMIPESWSGVSREKLSEYLRPARGCRFGALVVQGRSGEPEGWGHVTSALAELGLRPQLRYEGNGFAVHALMREAEPRP